MKNYTLEVRYTVGPNKKHEEDEIDKCFDFVWLEGDHVVDFQITDATGTIVRKFDSNLY